MASMNKQFGRYRLIGAMASGGMARLFLAQMGGADGFRRTVVLKRVLPQFARSREFIRMFINEAQLAARLDHPNIVRIYEFGEIESQYFISMEYLPGEDLSHTLRRCRKLNLPVPVPIVVAVGQAVAEALDCAHALSDEAGKPLGLVHRDVNPSNVIVTFHGITKLADFGIAKATQRSEVGTRAGVFKGKFAYASPEQVAGEELDARTDIFALGILMWELLALKRLFKRKNDAATIGAVCKAAVPPLSRLRSDVPPELDAIIAKTLSKRREERFQTASELTEALEELTTAKKASTREVRTWLVRLFGEERAELKKRITQGGNLDALALPSGELREHGARVLGLRPVRATSDDRDRSNPSMENILNVLPRPSSSDSAAPRPTTSWSIDRFDSGNREYSNPGSLSSVPLDDPTVVADGDHSSISYDNRASKTSESSSNRLLGLGVAIGTLVSIIGVVAVLAAGHSTPRKHGSDGSGRLHLSSRPSAAAIYVDGADTGKTTPAKLEALPTDRRVRVRVELEGYAPFETDVKLSRERMVEQKVTLSEIGRLSFKGLPGGAEVRIDGVPTDEPDSIQLVPGPHDIEVVKDNRVVHRKTVEVRPGNQIIQLNP